MTDPKPPQSATPPTPEKAPAKPPAQIKVAPKKVDRHARAVYQENYPDEVLTSRAFYNLGAGSFRHPYWRNVDFQSAHYDVTHAGKTMDIEADLSKCEPLPIESESAEVVYTSHLFEHIANESIQNLITESARILKPGGFLRITCPDHELAYAAYQNGDMRFLRTFSSVDKNLAIKERYLPITGIANIEHTLESAFLIRFARQVPMRRLMSSDEIRGILETSSMVDASDELVGRCSWDVHRKNPHHHINWLTKDKLFKMLEAAGFEHYYGSGYGQSRCPILRNRYHFDSTRPTLSLYVEAVKAR